MEVVAAQFVQAVTACFCYPRIVHHLWMVANNPYPWFEVAPDYPQTDLDPCEFLLDRNHCLRYHPAILEQQRAE